MFSLLKSSIIKLYNMSVYMSSIFNNKYNLLLFCDLIKGSGSVFIWY